MRYLDSQTLAVCWMLTTAIVIFAAVIDYLHKISNVNFVISKAVHEKLAEGATLTGVNTKLPLRNALALVLDMVGGKGANLGEMTRAGFPVPGGFCVTTTAYNKFIEQNQLLGFIAEKLLDGVRSLQTSAQNLEILHQSQETLDSINESSVE